MASYPQFDSAGHDSAANKVGNEALYYKIDLKEGRVVEANRLFVGNLAWDLPANGQPETGDEVLVGFEHGGSDTHHSDFLWSPSMPPELL